MRGITDQEDESQQEQSLESKKTEKANSTLDEVGTSSLPPSALLT
jgi:hypothetical protein